MTAVLSCDVVAAAVSDADGNDGRVLAITTSET